MPHRTQPPALISQATPAAITAPAQAQPSASTWAERVIVASDSDRLAGFDRLSGRTAKGAGQLAWTRAPLLGTDAARLRQAAQQLRRSADRLPLEPGDHRHRHHAERLAVAPGGTTGHFRPFPTNEQETRCCIPMPSSCST